MEGALLGAIGSLVGVTLGVVISQVLIHVINPQSFNWTMTTHFPVALMVSVVMALIAASAVTAMLPGRRAGRLVMCSVPFLFALCTLASASVAQAPSVGSPDVCPNRNFVFPADHGAHPEFRTEWWYVTGAVKTAEGKELGFQITFFRTRSNIGLQNPSNFYPDKCCLPMLPFLIPRWANFSMISARHVPVSGLRMQKSGTPMFT